MLVSVIIPTYNRAKYIAEAVQSVLDQKEPGCEIEVIVVDDGSTDNTQEVLAEFGDRIIYERTTNSGRPAVPRNIGIGLAKGELIAFQDSDDRWAPDKLKRQLPVFDDPEVLLSYGNAATMSADGKVDQQTVVAPESIKSGRVFNDLLNDNFISTLTVMVRRSAFADGARFDEGFAVRGVEDYQLWLTLSTRSIFQAVPTVLAYYRQHDQNISRVSARKAYQRQIATYLSLSGLTSDQRRRVHDRVAGLYSARATLPDGRVTDGLWGIWNKAVAKFYRTLTLINHEGQ
jgi:glycosyltransferase involved in cell wall biosynthesis